ncbi:MAG TPA: response regulator [Ignavibacteriales bacterium]|nr:response regulator [Ignavibacteriales bacterium]HOL80458.1 response regulator [Ignavibacteriales bacterium]HOM64909.1 response regulator [Ignavibacteriales bacterium]HPD68250.1 response regulator [Ignavibacteriales bacterium]HPP32647.1 response regulator [Ignavibacteriales bacterium]
MNNTFIPNKKVLYIDDEVHLLHAFKALMRKEDVEVFILEDSTKFQEEIEKNGPFAVILCDQRMPGLKGVEILEKLATTHPDTIKILITGFSDYNDTLRAINTGGISRYIQKPWNDADLKNTIKEAIHNYNLLHENKFLIDELRKNNLLLTELIDGALIKTVKLLSDISGFTNQEAAAQTIRVKKLGNAILSTYKNLSFDERWHVTCGFELFNLGISLLPAWLQVAIAKGGLNTITRFPAAKSHNILAANLLDTIPQFSPVANIIKYYTKNYDGTGEPETDNISGEQIPFGSRLLRIVIDYDKQANANYKGEVVLRDMMKNPNIYDVKIIEHVLNNLKSPQHEPPVEMPKNQPIKVNLTKLQSGMVLLEDIVSEKGTTLVSKNITITELEINFIRIWASARNEKIKEPIEVIIK